jgi:large subunit ribosomal protein L35
MPKMKTNKSVAKRLKVTGSGKIKRYSPGAGHLKSRKTPKQLRRFRKLKDMPKAFAKHAKRMMGM